MNTNEFLRNGHTLEQFGNEIDSVIDKFIGIDPPRFIVLAGAPASGKSTISAGRKYRDEFFHLLISQDDVKQEMMIRLGVDSDNKEWRHGFQDNAWEITKQILHTALLKKVNIVFDATLGNTIKYEQLFTFIEEHNLGYEYELDVVYAELAIIQYRNGVREKTTGHGVPAYIIDKIFHKIPSNVLMLFHKFSTITFWNNSISIRINSPEDSVLLFKNIFLDLAIDQEGREIFVSAANENVLKLFFHQHYSSFIEMLRHYVIEYDDNADELD